MLELVVSRVALVWTVPWKFAMSFDAGLCTYCLNVKVMRSDRGSEFYLCLLSFTDSRFPKYPALPVLKCEGYVQKPPPDSAEDSAPL